MPDAGHSRWSECWSSNSVGLGLAQLTRTPRQPLPLNANEWLKQAKVPGEHIVVLDDLNSFSIDEIEAWDDSISILQEQWLTPLMNALRSGEIDHLDLYACDGQFFRLTPNRLKFWMRRRKDLLHYTN